MNCPKCTAEDADYIDSRQVGEHRRRRYRCIACKGRFSTVEIAARLGGAKQGARLLPSRMHALRLEMIEEVRQSIDAILEKYKS